MAAEFDREWQIVLERVTQSQDLADLHEPLNKWRHTAYMEMREPGSYYRMLAKAEQITRTGANPDDASFEDMELVRVDGQRVGVPDRPRPADIPPGRCPAPAGPG